MSRYNLHFIFLLLLGLALANLARAKNQNSGNAQTVQEIFGFGFKNGQARSVDEACQLVSNEWHRFCREGFYASRLKEPSVLENFCGIKISAPLEGKIREQYLAYGIGAGYNSDPWLTYLQSTKDCLQGRRKYFLDGFAMGYALFLIHHDSDLEKVIQVCSSLSNLDRKICYFGLGRGLFFLQDPESERQFQKLKMDFPAIQDGFDFAQILAGRKSQGLNQDPTPGTFAAINLVEDFEMTVGTIEHRQKFKACLSSGQAHHYLCALRILRPEKYFVGK